MITLIEKLKEKLDVDTYVKMVLEDHSIIPILLEIIETDKTSVKFLAEKIIRQLSEIEPILLYPYFDRMTKLLDSNNNFIKWGFIITIPNLLSIDKDNKWNSISKHYLSFLDSTSIVEFGNTTSNVYKVLNAYPQYEKEIIPKLLAIDSHPFLYHGEVSLECINVAKGHIIKCFDKIYEQSNYKKEMLTFVEKNQDNSRKQVRLKAKKFLNNHQNNA